METFKEIEKKSNNILHMQNLPQHTWIVMGDKWKMVWDLT